ncbi:phosphatase PAP2 family protein [Antarcticibacterium sp. 1MA-6-2]|uniref:phosphatase PAP2 family protein n=1 Tax=Antarcticibacterium sp. 1MA-6-2 TaxID=2908210 RepID=UPI001F2D9A05|nr:phosphatase PAP2 family protein [Antarcticibacterium sp. 1MA-6-2]UJH91016.1 phosphatase PAP2 family protein [Antarcticibacterium sp. 1MA-6-2]
MSAFQAHCCTSANLLPYHLRRIVLTFFLGVVFLLPCDSFSQVFKDKDPNVETSGDAFIVLLLTSAVATSLILKDTKGTWQFTKSFVLNLAVTGAAKYLINKERPLEGGDYAFPSGHTSIAFQSASFYHRRYGFKYSIPAYILAGFTGYSRLNAARHDGWDVLAGAAVGIGSTWFFTTPLEEKQIQVSFSGDDDSYLLGLRYTF